MSHGKLREDKTCLNCGRTVEERFCTHCGQENTETRQPFHYLFTHFVEDFTHYDGQFWGTIKNLLFRPGKLTSIYLEGKRQKFVPPVKLYIFVSFITFFMFAVFPPFDINFEGKKLADLNKEKNRLSEMQKTVNDFKTKEKLTEKDSIYIEKLNAALRDSSKINDIEESLDMDKKLQSNEINISDENFINRPVHDKLLELQKKGYKKSEIVKGFIETILHNLPKALFIYLPIFAFFLWIFHHKKKWWYFDHGIFTLHYFSFLLLNILLTSLILKLADTINIGIINILLYLVVTILIIYSLIYFFIAHRHTYHSRGFVSILIGGILFTVNLFAFTFLLIGLAMVSFLMMH